jgi:hypothetical protein
LYGAIPHPIEIPFHLYADATALAIGDDIDTLIAALLCQSNPKAAAPIIFGDMPLELKRA